MKVGTILIGVLAIAILAGGAGCSKKDATITPDTYGIITKGYTAMRIDPMIFAGIIADLNKGVSVSVLQRSAEKTWVGKANDYWYKVRTKEGLNGWVFGQNITIHSGKGGKSMDSAVSDFMQVETARVKQYLSGKWWSANEFGDFTDHCLELYESGTYMSYLKGNESNPIVGTYTLDFNKSEIVFSNGTSFKSNLDLARRGNDYTLKKDRKDFQLRFTKISLETGPEPEVKNAGKPKPRAVHGNKAQ
jgi:hypothetical protein